MKKHKICKIFFVILAIFLCVAFCELLGICVAYKKQPEVSNTTKKETKNESWNECSENPERAIIIEKNPEALLQRVRLIKNAKDRVKIHTPYIICNDMMYNTWEEIAENVSDFSIMTNSVANNGNPFGSADYAKNRNRILSTGIDIWEYEGGYSYHGKSILIDDDLSVIGSFNMDMRSAYLDTELMLVIRSKDINKQLEEGMMEYEKVSRQVL